MNKSPAIGIIQEIKLSDTARLVSDSELTPAEEAFVYDFDIINGWREDMKSDTVITKDQGPVILTETRDNWIKNVQSTSKVKLLASIENEGIRLLLVLFKQDISLYNHSSRIYAFGIVNSEVKSIVRVAESSAYEDSYIKSFTILDEGSFTYNEEYKNSPSASVVYKYSKEGHITPL
ncbi:hypothetical protein LVD17_00160 [Fulvivirga ulvae]|uniref:hypothetical protein n=1 Tax=Fulvivirga ulvae TaxID=2904245 RepID=UPI001F2A4959|nr:hypothetical protein [Fulvivirga ulvae]UII32249.1 hypothetical protein LVD17_00160 [Fulvivirga ulvae]